jgi:hypothetical protein
MRESDADSNDGDQAGLVLILVIFYALPVFDDTLHGLNQGHKLRKVLAERLSIDDLEEIAQLGLL